MAAETGSVTPQLRAMFFNTAKGRKGGSSAKQQEWRSA